MTLFFFNHEIENPVLRAVIALGAVIFAVSVVLLVLAVALPLAGVAITGALIITGVLLIIVLIAVPFLSFFGILFSNRIKGSGVEDTRTIEVEPFDSVKMSGAVKIDIVCGQPQTLEVTTDDNLFESVKTVVEKNELSVSFSRSVSSKTAIRLRVGMAELKSLRLYGATKATVKNLDSQEFLVRGSGASKVTVAGSCKNMDARFSGAGNLSAGDLISEKVKIRIRGSGRAVVYASEKISVKISGAGKVVCHGNPEKVQKHISGAGKLEILQ